jgi:hypothetical protein
VECDGHLSGAAGSRIRIDGESRRSLIAIKQGIVSMAEVASFECTSRNVPGPQSKQFNFTRSTPPSTSHCRVCQRTSTGLKRASVTGR